MALAFQAPILIYYYDSHMTLGQAGIQHMIEVLQPLKEKDSHTASIDVQVRDDQTTITLCSRVQYSTMISLSIYRTEQYSGNMYILCKVQYCI